MQRRCGLLPVKPLKIKEFDLKKVLIEIGLDEDKFIDEPQLPHQTETKAEEPIKWRYGKASHPQTPLVWLVKAYQWTLQNPDAENPLFSNRIGRDKFLDYFYTLLNHGADPNQISVLSQETYINQGDEKFAPSEVNIPIYLYTIYLLEQQFDRLPSFFPVRSILYMFLSHPAIRINTFFYSGSPKKQLYTTALDWSLGHNKKKLWDPFFFGLLLSHPLFEFESYAVEDFLNRVIIGRQTTSLEEFYGWGGYNLPAFIFNSENYFNQLNQEIIENKATELVGIFKTLIETPRPFPLPNAIEYCKSFTNPYQIVSFTEFDSKAPTEYEHCLRNEIKYQVLLESLHLPAELKSVPFYNKLSSTIEAWRLKATKASKLKAITDNHLKESLKAAGFDLKQSFTTAQTVRIKDKKFEATPLTYAVTVGDKYLVQTLFMVPEVKQKEEKEQTALQIAIENVRLPIIYLLLHRQKNLEPLKLIRTVLTANYIKPHSCALVLRVLLEDLQLAQTLLTTDLMMLLTSSDGLQVLLVLFRSLKQRAEQLLIDFDKFYYTDKAPGPFDRHHWVEACFNYLKNLGVESTTKLFNDVYIDYLVQKMLVLKLEKLKIEECINITKDDLRLLAAHYKKKDDEPRYRALIFNTYAYIPKMLKQKLNGFDMMEMINQLVDPIPNPDISISLSDKALEKKVKYAKKIFEIEEKLSQQYGAHIPDFELVNMDSYFLMSIKKMFDKKQISSLSENDKLQFIQSSQRLLQFHVDRKATQELKATSLLVKGLINDLKLPIDDDSLVLKSAAGTKEFRELAKKSLVRPVETKEPEVVVVAKAPVPKKKKEQKEIVITEIEKLRHALQVWDGQLTRLGLERDIICDAIETLLASIKIQLTTLDASKAEEKITEKTAEFQVIKDEVIHNNEIQDNLNLTQEELQKAETEIEGVVKKLQVQIQKLTEKKAELKAYQNLLEERLEKKKRSEQHVPKAKKLNTIQEKLRLKKEEQIAEKEAKKQQERAEKEAQQKAREAKREKEAQAKAEKKRAQDEKKEHAPVQQTLPPKKEFKEIKQTGLMYHQVMDATIDSLHLLAVIYHVHQADEKETSMSSAERESAASETHYALIYTIFRVLFGLRVYQKLTAKEAIPDQVLLDMRNMMHHHGALNASRVAVLESAKQYCLQMPETMTKDLLRLSAQQRKEILQSYNFLKKEDFLSEIKQYKLLVDETPLWKELEASEQSFGFARQLYADLAKEQESIADRLWPLIIKFNSMMETIYKQGFTMWPVISKDQDRFRQINFRKLCAMKALISIIGEFGDSQICVTRRKEILRLQSGCLEEDENKISALTQLGNYYEFLRLCRENHNAVGHRFPDFYEADFYDLYAISRLITRKPNLSLLVKPTFGFFQPQEQILQAYGEAKELKP